MSVAKKGLQSFTHMFTQLIKFNCRTCMKHSNIKANTHVLEHTHRTTYIHSAHHIYVDEFIRSKQNFILPRWILFFIPAYGFDMRLLVVLAINKKMTDNMELFVADFGITRKPKWRKKKSSTRSICNSWIFQLALCNFTWYIRCRSGVLLLLSNNVVVVIQHREYHWDRKNSPFKWRYRAHGVLIWTKKFCSYTSIRC